MPQLDQFTYFTQFMWLCVFYMVFYVLLFNDGLPKISRILKLRAHLLSQQVSSVGTPKAGSVGGDLINSQDVIFRALISGINYLSSSISGAFNWCGKSVNNLNAHQLKPTNKSFLQLIGEINISQKIKNNALDSCAPITLRTIKKSLEVSRVWSLRVQKCIVNSSLKKKKKK